ncbi:MAG TPA: ComEC/Rec2 family competence protein [bacterium]|nr:ComEC/Rec2 family competence protein [bacterium]
MSRKKRSGVTLRTKSLDVPLHGCINSLSIIINMSRKIVIYLILIFILVLRAYFSIPNCKNVNNICYYSSYKTLNIRGIVDSQIDSNNFNLKVFSINDKKVNGNISVNYYGKKNVNFYDKIDFLCSVKNIDGSYKQYLENKNIYLVCNMKDFNIINIDEGLFLKIKYKIFNFAYYVKDKIIERIDYVFDEKYSGFLSSFLLGDKRFLPKRIENLMVDKGISHIISISGFNINIIVAFIYFLFINIGVNRKIVFYIISPILFLFSIMTGLNPPVLRASIMMFCILFMQQIGRPYNTIKILLFVCYIMLLYNPKYILDVSFLLSFLSTFAIIFIKPKVEKKIPDNIAKYLENIISTFCIFFITSPIVFIFFNKLNFMSILYNIAILPFISYLYLFSFLSLIFKPLAFIPCCILDYIYLLIC